MNRKFIVLFVFVSEGLLIYLEILLAKGERGKHTKDTKRVLIIIKKNT